MSLLEVSKTYKPFNYEWAVQAAESHESLHWVEQEADLADDVKDWQILDEPARNLITQILKLFTQSDAQVASNYIDFFLPTFKNNEIRQMLLSFACREGIHQRAYALLSETLNLPDSEFQAFLEYTEMADKIEFMSDNDTKSFTGIAHALAKSVFSEGVSLFGSFIMLLHFQRYGKMKGMGTIVKWSIIDETDHVAGISKLFREFCDEHPRIVNDEFKAAIYDMARKTYELECKFIDLAFELGPVDGLEAEEVKGHIRALVDRRLTQLGLKPNYGDGKFLEWFDEIMSGTNIENFFESRVTEYTVKGMTGDFDDYWNS